MVVDWFECMIFRIDQQSSTKCNSKLLRRMQSSKPETKIGLQDSSGAKPWLLGLCVERLEAGKVRKIAFRALFPVKACARRGILELDSLDRRESE